MFAPETLTPVLEELQLEPLLRTLPQRTREAQATNLSYEEFLFRVLHDAARARRDTSAVHRRAAWVRVGPEARWLEVAGRRRVDLSRRGPIRRILAALVHAHATRRPLEVGEVVAAGWPGEIVPTEAGATRVYTAIRTLRRLGLEGVLLTLDAGYRLDPRTPVTTHDE